MIRLRKVLIVFSLFAASLFFGFYLYNSGRNIVDSNYISSKEYQSLENELDKNKAANRDKQSTLALVARKVLISKESNLANYPYVIDTLAIKSITSPENKIALSSSNAIQSEFDNYEFYPVAAVNQQETISRIFFLMQRQGIYRDIEVVLVTIKDTSLIDMESIGEFPEKSGRKNNMYYTNQQGSHQNKNRKVAFLSRGAEECNSIYLYRNG